MQYRVLYDYAINTGELYPIMCDMARMGSPAHTWRSFVRLNVLPLYRRQCHEPNEGMSQAEIKLCAKELKAYYEQHVKEMDVPPSTRTGYDD